VKHFSLDILHWMDFKGFTFAKGETFFNTARCNLTASASWLTCQRLK
jgi:hypothetical protein